MKSTSAHEFVKWTSLRQEIKHKNQRKFVISGEEGGVWGAGRFNPHMSPESLLYILRDYTGTERVFSGGPKCIKITIPNAHQAV